jgi:hypothetical protein
MNKQPRTPRHIQEKIADIVSFSTLYKFNTDWLGTVAIEDIDDFIDMLNNQLVKFISPKLLNETNKKIIKRLKNQKGI